jgi:hypothetical protein
MWDEKLSVVDADSGKIIGKPFPIVARFQCFRSGDEVGGLFDRRWDDPHFHEDSQDAITAVQTLQTEFGAKGQYSSTTS